MSSYAPPTENVAIFDTINFTSGDVTITQSQADKRYLRFPNAQGTENLQAINVNGLATFNADMVVADGGATTTIGMDNSFGLGALEIYNTANGGLTYIQNDSSTGTKVNSGFFSAQTVAFNAIGNINLQLTTGQGLSLIASGVNLNKPLTLIGSGADSLVQAAQYNIRNLGSDAVLGAIYGNSPDFIYDNNINNGGHIWATNNGAGVQSNPFSFNSTDLTIATVNPPTCAASSTIATSDDSNKLPSTAWVRDYVATVPALIPANLTPNSINIIPTTLNSPTAGINCYINNNARISWVGTGGANNTDVNAFVSSPFVFFDFNNGNTTPTLNICITYRISFTFWNSSNFGQTSCLIDFYPNRWTQGLRTGNQLYNINNKINGNGNYVYTDATFAPSGRQYWTYQQNFSGVSGPNALFIPNNGVWQLLFCIPDNSYSFQGCVEALNTTNANNTGYGVLLHF